jgi:hypothetical protein
MTAYWHETFPERLDDDQTARPVPHTQLPAGATCILTAGGQPPDEIELAQIAQFREFLKLKREIGAEAGHAAIYGQEDNHG